jgi:hypothetical protein
MGGAIALILDVFCLCDDRGAGQGSEAWFSDQGGEVRILRVPQGRIATKHVGQRSFQRHPGVKARSPGV